MAAHPPAQDPAQVAVMKVFLPLLDVESVLPILSKIAIFGGVSDDQLHTVLTCLEVGAFAAKEPIFQRGEDPTHIYVVKSGMVELLITDGAIVLEKKTLGVGDCFGLASLMAMHRHTDRKSTRLNSSHH
jgi:CRP/FNR family transcriptional regulator, cyclic AMP receptor protein